MISDLKAPFLYQGKVDKLPLLLFLAINLLVLTNNILHNPIIGYDADEYLKYIRSLSDRLPDYSDTNEFFSAPLPYFLPSLVDKACLSSNAPEIIPETIDHCQVLAGKSAQIINVVLSIGVTFFIIRISAVVQPSSRYLKISALALLGVMTVYYKTFSQVRGEPYLLFFTIWTIFLLVQMIYSRQAVTWRCGILLGIILGSMLLSRQWGFMLLPAIAGLWALVCLLDNKNRRQFTAAIFVSAMVACLICAWFYLSLYVRYDSFFPFNRSPLDFSFSNQPSTFYRNTGLKNFLLFKSPTRGTFNNQLFPILYSDLWGDYWGHFVFIHDQSYLGERGYGNIKLVTPYLGRVNLVSLFPSLIFLAGLISASITLPKLASDNPEEKNRSIYHFFLLLFVLASFFLYLYFLIIYPILEEGDTIKASYLLHMLVVLPLLGAEFLEVVRTRNPKLYSVSMALLGLVFAHNLPAMVTRYWFFL